MIWKIPPIIETLTKETVEQVMANRYDICVCPICKKDILAQSLAGIHPSQDTIEADSSETAAAKVRTQYLSTIHHAIHSAVEKVSEHPSHPLTEDRKKTFKLLLQKILQDRGMDFRNYHADLLKRRFAIRIKANSLFSYSEYMKLLDKSPREYDRLFETLCINVSEFFRDPPLWVTLQYLLDHMIAEKIRKGDHSLTIWSAGCANGEEAYSLAIAAVEALRSRSHTMKPAIIATDIDTGGIATAKKALYNTDSIKNINDKLLAKYFTAVDKQGTNGTGKNKMYRVNDAITSLVSFSTLDLITGEFPRGVDLLACRNVFIYFNRELQEKILRKFFEAIKPGGYLCLGQSESMITEVRRLFEDTDSNARIYKRP